MGVLLKSGSDVAQECLRCGSGVAQEWQSCGTGVAQVGYVARSQRPPSTHTADMVYVPMEQ